jgi:hypothetical protein
MGGGEVVLKRYGKKEKSDYVITSKRVVVQHFRSKREKEKERGREREKGWEEQREENELG